MSANCKTCKAEYRKQYKLQNPDTIKDQAHRTYIKHRESRTKKNSEWAKKNIKLVRRIKSRWAKNNRPICRAKLAKYRAKQLRATPKWANLEAIKEFYMKCPIGFEVDHIIPLQGRDVSGLHVLENLQYLPMSLNRKKKNHFDGTPENNNWSKI